MTYDGGYPHIVCMCPPGSMRDDLLDALYNQNATCLSCGEPFDDDDKCWWPERKARVTHILCNAPQNPPQALMDARHADILERHKTAGDDAAQS